MKHYHAYLLNDLGEIFHEEDVEAFEDIDGVAAGWNLLESHNANHPDTAAFGLEVRLGQNLIFNSWIKPL